MAKDDNTKQFTYSDELKYPRDIVYPVFRNESIRLADYLPNIALIEEIERHEHEEGVSFILKWHARAKLPGPAAKLIPENAMTWVDKATYFDATHSVNYELTFPMLGEAVRVHGTNRFEAVGDKTRVTVSGTIEADINKIPFAPKMVLKRVVPLVQDFAAKQTEPNLIEMNRGIEKYLEESGRV
ncbi:MAG: DUF2505 family protein [Deltaproteobacteria bacterium]|nr:DUF2505 family protein [bacterium]MCB9479561.1 DUF2505 family protein [Deltaproteobacteria bacterium]MCB9488409.1 DUF2505 family protein [Deltaproteobacteria bacterium]